MSSHMYSLLVMVIRPIITGLLAYIILMDLGYKILTKFVKYVKSNRGEDWNERKFRNYVNRFIISFTILMLINSLIDFFVYHKVIR